MSTIIIGLSFGSHSASIALWYEDKNLLEVIADDLGFRNIPCAVAFRGTEVITGQAAISQQHKNPTNTFDDVRSLLLNPELATVFVPALEKEISVQELASHFFRNIHNQIKQQVGSIVRTCILSVPDSLSPEVKTKIVESAQQGGIQVKSFIDDSVASLLAYEVDDHRNNATSPTSIYLNVDLGWSKSELSLWRVSQGLIQPLGTSLVPQISGNTLVRLLSEFCAKDFQRKHKVPCLDNKRSMTRLLRECEVVMKTLSSGSEATVDLDSFCEGIDFSLKLTRARFEDVAGTPFMHFRAAVNALLAQSGVSVESVSQVCLSGGLASIPKTLATLRAIFPHINVHKTKIDPAEAQCIGACLQGKYLVQQSLLEAVPSSTISSPCSAHALYLSGQPFTPPSPSTTSEEGSSPPPPPSASSLGLTLAMPAFTVLPSVISIPAQLTPSSESESTNSYYLQLLVQPEANSFSSLVPLADLTFSSPAPTVEVVVSLSASEIGAIHIDVQKKEDSSILASLDITI